MTEKVEWIQIFQIPQELMMIIITQQLEILIMSNYLIKEHPKYYEYFKIKDFTYITQGNRNPLLYKNI